MQPRSLQQILTELDSTYNPQIDSVRQRQALIPGQIAEEEKGLGAKQEQAFGDILSGARRRGVGFSGIPLGEQAKYTATDYLPALAKLRQSGREQAMSLEDAILGIQERKNTFGQQIFQQERDRAEQQRQFNEQQAATQRAAAAQNAAYGGIFGGAAAPATQRPPDAYAAVDKQSATNAVLTLLKTGNAGLINKTISAITGSANKGNLYDKFKLELLAAYAQNTPFSGILNKANTYNPASPVAQGTKAAIAAARR